MKPSWFTPAFQQVGLIPLGIFVYRLAQYISVGTPDWIMYNCHITTLMLFFGMTLGLPLLIRVAAIWLVIGLPMWLIDAWVIREIWIASVVSHLGGFLLAIYAIRRVRATGTSWAPALGWFLLWQLVTRYTTDPKLNINIAHTAYAGCERWFASYWAFWPLCAVVAGGMAWMVEYLLAKRYPAQAREASETMGALPATGAPESLS